MAEADWRDVICIYILGARGRKTLIWGITRSESGFFWLQKENVHKKLTLLSKAQIMAGLKQAEVSF